MSAKKYNVLLDGDIKSLALLVGVGFLMGWKIKKWTTPLTPKEIVERERQKKLRHEEFVRRMRGPQ